MSRSIAVLVPLSLAVQAGPAATYWGIVMAFASFLPPLELKLAAH
jgi:hypothetical protein